MEENLSVADHGGSSRCHNRGSHKKPDPLYFSQTATVDEPMSHFHCGSKTIFLSFTFSKHKTYAESMITVPGNISEIQHTFQHGHTISRIEALSCI